MLDLDRLGDAFKFINEKVVKHTGQPLSELESAIVRGSLQKKSYKEIAAESLYTDAYLQHNAGPTTWKLLREVFGRLHPEIGKSLQKHSFREAVLRMMDLEEEATRSKRLEKRVLSGQIPDTSEFLGREAELERMRGLVETFRCVTLLGGAGIGKSAVTSYLVQNLDLSHEVIIWKALRYEESVAGIVNSLLQNLGEAAEQSPTSQVSQLLEHLRARRCLIIFDSAECLQSRAGLSNSDGGQTLPGLIQVLATETHQSCLLLTSREPIREVLRLQQQGYPCRSYQIRGLSTAAAVKLLKNQGLKEASDKDLQSLITRYRGEPLDLKLVATYIQQYCGGNVRQFLSYETTLMSDVRQESLDQLFRPNGLLTSLERSILVSISQVSASAGKLKLSEITQSLDSTIQPLSMTELLKGLDLLQQLSLLEVTTDTKNGESYYEVTPAIQKYVRVNASRLIKMPTFQKAV